MFVGLKLKFSGVARISVQCLYFYNAGRDVYSASLEP